MDLVPTVSDSDAPASIVAKRFISEPSEESFAKVFEAFTPHLVSFFRGRGCGIASEDLAQEVMLTVYSKASQVRDATRFRAWMFKVARGILCRHYGTVSRNVETVDLGEIADHVPASKQSFTALPSVEFRQWMSFLDSREREVMTLRFVHECEYHEIAAAQDIPIGTVQWRVFNAKRKLTPLMRAAAPLNWTRQPDCGARR